MSLLTSAPAGAEETPSEGAEGAGGEGEDQQQEAAPVVSQPVPLPKPNRRQAAAQERDELVKKVAGFEETLAKEREETRRQFAERDAQNHRTLMETIQRLVPQQTQQSQGPNPDDLDKKADEALEAGKYEEYKRLNRQAVEARMESRLTALRQELTKGQQQGQAQGMPPEVQMVIMTSPDAQKVMGHPRGMAAAVLEDRKLGEVYGLPAGPDRYRKAFELASKELFGKQGGQGQFSANGRDVLGGAPTSRGNGRAAGGEKSVRPPPGWEGWADRAGMTRAEYLEDWAKLHPEDVSE